MLNYTTKLLLYASWAIVSIAQARAQQQTEHLSRLYNRTWQSFNVSSDRKTLDDVSVKPLFHPDTFHYQDRKKAIIEEQLRLTSKEWGLNFLSSYTRNYGQGFNDETENFTRDRFALELQWNLLGNGYRDGKISNQIATNNLKIHELEEQQYLKEREYGYQYNTIIYLFNKAKIDLLDSRLNKLESLDTCYDQLYLDHLIPYIEVLKVRKIAAKYALLLGDYKSFNREFEIIYDEPIRSVEASALPIYQVLIDQLIDHAYSDKYSDQLLDYKNQNVVLNEQLQKEIRFKVFARRTYTAGALDGFDRKFNTLGVGLNVPISTLMDSKKKMTELQIDQNVKDHEYKVYHIKKELMNHYYEYEYNLQQYQQMRFEAQRLDEIIRKDQLQIRDTTFHVSIINSFELLNERGEIEIELLGLKEQLYLKLLKIQSLSYTQDMMTYLARQPSFEERKLLGERYAMISENDITNFGLDVISAYLKNSEIKKLIPSSLPEHIQEKLVEDGFQIHSDWTENTLLVDPTLFKSKRAMETYIASWLKLKQSDKLIITDLSDLLQLEIKSINEQQQ